MPKLRRHYLPAESIKLHTIKSLFQFRSNLLFNDHLSFMLTIQIFKDKLLDHLELHNKKTIKSKF